MPSRRVRARAIAFDALRQELELPAGFPPDALAEAEQAARRPPGREGRVDLTDVPFVTIDPVGSRDLDQAVHLSRQGAGFRLRYAIADVASFLRPAGALDAETHRRGETVYLPDGRVPLHPPVLGEGAASLLPDEERPAVVWTLDLDADAEPVSVGLGRALVRSTARLDYGGVQAAADAGTLPEPVALLPTVGRLRQERAAERGAVDLRLPDQEVEPVGRPDGPGSGGDTGTGTGTGTGSGSGGGSGGGWRLVLRAPLPVEDFNAQVSLLTGMCAARIMLDGGVGLLRTLPPARDQDVERLRGVARGLGVDWPDGAAPGAVVAGVDPASPRGAAFLDEAATLLRGAGYTAFDGAPPEQPLHAGVAAPYAHVTAPLRRLADRYATEVCLALHAGEPVPAWVREALPGLPATMATSGRRTKEVERAVVDLTEATLLTGRVGEVFDGSVVDVHPGHDGGAGSATVSVDEPPVRARCTGPGLQAGARVRLRLVEADPGARRVAFTLA